MRSRTVPSTAQAAEAADTVLRLAVLLQAGVAPMRSWEQLAAVGDPAALRVCRAVAAGMPLADAIAHTPAQPGARTGRRQPAASVRDDADLAWRDVSAAWRVATTVGAPMADSLRGVAAALRDTQAARDEVRVALAEPAGTARLMSWLPLVGVALGVALGFDTVGVLVGTPMGIACLVAGLALTLAARSWSAALVRRAHSAMTVPGLAAEVLAIALSAGVSGDRARRLVEEATGEGPDDAAMRVLDLSRRAGVPAVELLRASAGLERHHARTAGRLRAAALSTRLLLPLGACTLPAFLLLGVAPMLLGVMTVVPFAV